MSKNILLIPDTQIRPNNLDLNGQLMDAIGQLIVDRKPDIVVHIGDHWDMYSLNTYDMSKNNKRTFDGDAVYCDVLAGREAMSMMLQPLVDLQERQRANKHRVYKPEMHFTIGNHEERIKRFPELKALLGYEELFEGTPWVVHDYLAPVEIEGILFSHYFYNPLSGRPFGGTADYRLNKIKQSFVQGHEQTFRYAKEYLANGRSLSGLIAGACYLHDEPYKGQQGNHHFRGLCYLHDAHDGTYDLEKISVQRLLK